MEFDDLTALRQQKRKPKIRKKIIYEDVNSIQGWYKQIRSLCNEIFIMPQSPIIH